MLRAAVDPSRPPYQFLEDGKLTGFIIDAAVRLAGQLGVSIVFHPMDDATALQAMHEGRIDLVLGYPYRPAEPGRLIFSEPMAASSIGVLVDARSERFRDGLGQLADSVVALTRDSAAYDLLKQIRTIRFNETARPADALALLELGRAEVVLEDRLVLQHLLRENGNENRFRFASSYWLPVEYVMAVSSQDSYLVWQLNNGLRAIKASGSYGELYGLWFDDTEQATQRRLRQLLAASAVIATAMLGILGIGLWWNRQLAASVRERTVELRQANEDLAARIVENEDRNQFIRQVLESSPRAILAFDRSGRVSSCNDRARELCRFAIEPFGATWESLPPLDLMIRDRLGQVAQDGQRFLFQTLAWEQPGGELLQLRYNLYPLVDHDRIPAGLICTIEDYTEEKLLRDRVVEREKSEALGRIVAGMAHEIRNPLTSIKAFVELLPRKFDNPRFREELFTFVPREVERVDGLIRSLIDFARPVASPVAGPVASPVASSSESLEASPEAIAGEVMGGIPRTAIRCREDLQELTRSCLALLQPLAGKRGSRIDGNSNGEFFVRIDRDQYKQALINFVMNALDAIDEKAAAISLAPAAPGVDWRTVTVQLARHAGKVVLTIADQGAGMNQDQLDRVFEPFYTTKPRGVGLGLPLSRHFVQDNQGQLWIQSSRECGTVVTVEFPEDQVS